MKNILHVIIGNKKTGEVKWVRYHLEDVDEDEICLDQHPGSVPEYPKLPVSLSYDDLNTTHDDPVAPHRIWMAVIDESIVQDAIEAIQDAIRRWLEFDMKEIKAAQKRLRQQQEVGVEMTQAMPLRWNTEVEHGGGRKNARRGRGGRRISGSHTHTVITAPGRCSGRSGIPMYTGVKEVSV